MAGSKFPKRFIQNVPDVTVTSGTSEPVNADSLKTYVGLIGTIRAMLDILTSTRGSILYRGSSGWVGLAPGTSGYFLQSAGSGNDPTYAQVTPATIREAKQTLTDGATITWNISSGRNAQVTLGGNRTLAFSNVSDGDYGTLLVIQDGTGGRTITLPSGSYVQGVGASTACSIKSAASGRTLLTFWYDGTNYYWSIGKY